MRKRSLLWRLTQMEQRRRGGASVAAAVLTYIGNTKNTTDGSSFTFTGASIGTASADRQVIVVACAVEGIGIDQTITGCTIGGNGATSVANAASSEPGVGFTTNCRIFQLAVAAGTTADIVVTCSGTMGVASIDVYTITGLQSTTPFHTNSNSAITAATTIATTINVPNNGVTIGGSCWYVTSLAFTGLTKDTTSDALSTPTSGAAAASGSSMSAETGRSVTVTAASNNRRTIVVASWG